MRFEVIAAFAIGILLPVLETCRRGISEWSVDFTTMFTDYFAGALLLIGGWARVLLVPTQKHIGRLDFPDDLNHSWCYDVTGDRSGGFPRMAGLGDEVHFAWTEFGKPHV